MSRLPTFVRLLEIAAEGVLQPFVAFAQEHFVLTEMGEFHAKQLTACVCINNHVDIARWLFDNVPDLPWAAGVIAAVKKKGSGARGFIQWLVLEQHVVIRPLEAEEANRLSASIEADELDSVWNLLFIAVVYRDHATTTFLIEELARAQRNPQNRALNMAVSMLLIGEPQVNILALFNALPAVEWAAANNAVFYCAVAHGCTDVAQWLFSRKRVDVMEPAAVWAAVNNRYVETLEWIASQEFPFVEPTFTFTFPETTPRVFPRRYFAVPF